MKLARVGVAIAAAAIVALGGGEAERTAVEAALRHYDYAKLNMAEFFFAECAYYALDGPGRDSRSPNPPNKPLP